METTYFKKTVDSGEVNCPLCRIYNNPALDVDKKCVGCPIMEFTGKDYCAGTPYVAWSGHHIKVHNKGIDTYHMHNECKVCLRHAKAELKFLQSLKEKEKALKEKTSKTENETIKKKKEH